MGCGPIEQLTQYLAELLPRDTVLSVVCGTNEKLLCALSRQRKENVFLFGYTNKVPLLMDSAELFLTKPGGISTSEAAVKKLPMLLIDTVGGCERRNLEYFIQHGWARTENTPEKIAQCCADLLRHPTALSESRAGLAEAFDGKAGERILSHLDSTLREKADLSQAKGSRGSRWG